LVVAKKKFRFMVGDARDKDAVAATLLICEVAARKRKHRLQRIAIV
jgi:hypothetical protein